MKIRINQEHIIGIICIILGIIIFFFTAQFPSGQTNIEVSGPAFFPNILAVILIIVGIVEIVVGTFFTQQGGLKVKNILQIVNQPGFINVVIIIMAFVCYIIFVPILGFITTTVVFLLIVLWRLKVPLWKNIIYSIVLTGIILIIFVKLFSVTLPSGILF